LETEAFYKTLEKKLLVKYQVPQSRKVVISSLKEFRAIMREIQLVPNFMSEYKLKEAYVFYGKEKLATDDFVKLCYTAFGANTSMQDLFSYAEFKDGEKEVFE
jgi:hypothetical protein